ncbi:hypothetical protein [Halobellus rufus]|uniref:hypothetical protein n=1 Tax=Halobellus rufus TaxID=1448860 RepID=UPI0006784E6A|nr:hypothetical protein [Halobellus rufus]
MIFQTALLPVDALATALAVSLQLVDPSAVTTVPASYRAALAFMSSTIVGGAVLYLYGNRLRTAVRASTESVPLSVLYGLFAYALAGFLVAYGLTQLAGLGVDSSAVLTVAAVALAGALLTLGGIGYVVVGAWLAESAGLGDPWIGLVGVGLLGAVAVLVLPVALGAVAWFGIAAFGIGGSVRRWVHADAAEREAKGR